MHSLLQETPRPAQFPPDAAGFENALASWENKVSKWDSLAVDVLNDAIKRQVLIERGPPGIRVHLTPQGHATYPLLRQAVVD